MEAEGGNDADSDEIHETEKRKTEKARQNQKLLLCRDQRN